MLDVAFGDPETVISLSNNVFSFSVFATSMISGFAGSCIAASGSAWLKVVKVNTMSNIFFTARFLAAMMRRCQAAKSDGYSGFPHWGKSRDTRVGFHPIAIMPVNTLSFGQYQRNIVVKSDFRKYPIRNRQVNQ